MIRSMTGYANKTGMVTINEQKIPLTVAIKSVNSRFFEAKFRLPQAITPLEHTLQKLLKKELLRGNVYCTMHLPTSSIFKSAIQPAYTVVQGYLEAAQNIKKKFSVSGELSLDRLMTMPNVLEISEKELDEETKKEIIILVSQTIAQLIDQQEQEGANLKKDIEKRFFNMQTEIETIQKVSISLIDEEKEKIHKAIEALPIEESQFELMQKNALYTYLDKIDIHEEIIRFKSHLVQITKQLESKQIEKGKRLDFTLQELGREINTIAAKGSNAQIGQKAIDIKVELEKAREQAQNIV